jgi:hypothetical protein
MAAEGVRLLYSCKTQSDYANASKVFRELEAKNQVNAAVVVAFMQTSRACGYPREVLALWNSLPRLQVEQNVDIAINTIVACASIGSQESLQV